jgi:hypothetical protein
MSSTQGLLRHIRFNVSTQLWPFLLCHFKTSQRSSQSVAGETDALGDI